MTSCPIRSAGCPINGTTQVPTGGSGVIVIVDAYDYPSAAADLATFSTTFGLPQANFSVQYASGRKPSNGCSSGWKVRNRWTSSGPTPWRPMPRSF